MNKSKMFKVTINYWDCPRTKDQRPRVCLIIKIHINIYLVIDEKINRQNIELFLMEFRDMNILINKF